MADNTDPTADFNVIIGERGKNVTLKKPTVTTGPSGEVTAVSEAQTTVAAMRRRIADKDRDLLKQGIALRGDIKGFYRADSDVEEGDTITDTIGDVWRVKAMFRRLWDDGTEIFRKTVERRINDG